MPAFHMDYETASELDLKKVGAHRYARHPSTRILMCSYAMDDGPVDIWEPHKDPMPLDFYKALNDPSVTKKAFNAQFERLITKFCLGADVPAEQWRCTMVDAYYLGFAGNLNNVLKAIGLPPKDPRGDRLINMFCSPAPKNHKADWYTWENRPEEWEEFKEYCLQDTRVERELCRWMSQFPQMPQWDRQQWILDQRINDRGVPMDTEMADAAIHLWDRERDRLTKEMKDATGLEKVTREPFIQWVAENTGVVLENTRKDYLESLLAKEALPEEARYYVDLWRQKEAKATSKYAAVLAATGDDGRARGMFQYKGASRTDRVGGRVIQLQNLKRPLRDPKKDPAHIDRVVTLIKDRDPMLLRLWYPESVSEVLGGSIRHVISAEPGNVLAVCDLTSIESVVLGWLSYCAKIDETFRSGKDTYRVFATEYFGIQYDEVTKGQRTFSKPPVLGCFAADTKVLTSSGWKDIIHVSATDKVFDGHEWVTHDGVCDQGRKECIKQFGVTATPDHEFLVREGEWVQFKDLTAGRLRQATSTARGWCWNMWAIAITVASVLAGQSRMCMGATSGAGEPVPVWPVLTKDSRKNGLLQRRWASLKKIMTGWRGGFMPNAADVRTQTTPATRTTEAEGSSADSKIPGQRSHTSQRSRGGTTPPPRSTASTITDTMSQGTFVSQTEAETPTTPVSTERSHIEEGSTRRPSSGGSSRHSIVTKALLLVKSVKERLRNKSSTNSDTVEVPTFDILNAGPRNRFTILTEKGPVIVHNCGFMLGWRGLIAYAEGMGVTLTPEEAKRAVDTFRSMYPEIVAFWQWIHEAAKYTTLTGRPCEGYRLTVERDADFLRIWLPSGRALSYFKPEVRKMEAPWSEPGRPAYVDNFTYMGMDDKNQWTRIAAHAGGLTENIVQSIAGDLLWNGIRNSEDAGVPVILHVHDEIGSEVHELQGPWALGQLKLAMTTQPGWCRDMWLGADGFLTHRYTKD